MVKLPDRIASNIFDRNTRVSSEAFTPTAVHEKVQTCLPWTEPRAQLDTTSVLVDLSRACKPHKAQPHKDCLLAMQCCLSSVWGSNLEGPKTAPEVFYTLQARPGAHTGVFVSGQATHLPYGHSGALQGPKSSADSPLQWRGAPFPNSHCQSCTLSLDSASTLASSKISAGAFMLEFH